MSRASSPGGRRAAQWRAMIALVACLAAPSVARAQIVTGLGAASAIVEIGEEQRRGYEAVLVKRQQAIYFYVEAAAFGGPGLALLIAGGVELDREPVLGTLLLALGGAASGVALIIAAIALGHDLGASSQLEQWMRDTGLSLSFATSRDGALLSIGGRL